MGRAVGQEQSIRQRAARSQADELPLARELPAPLLALLQAQLGHQVVAEALLGGGQELGQLVRAALSQESEGRGLSDAPLGSNQALQALLASPSTDPAERSQGEPLSGELATRYGAASGQELSAVRVHTDAAAAAAIAERGVAAFARGEDVFFGAGVDPTSSAGEALLAHELGHVVQHREGRLSGEAAKGAVATSADPLEQEADALATEVQPAPEEGTPAPGWLVDAVALFSPLLAAVLEHGIVGAFEEQFEDGAQSFLEETFGSTSPDAIADSLVAGLWNISGLVVGAASGDQACCEAMTKWLTEKVEEADALLLAGTQLAELATAQKASWTEALGQLGAFLDGQGLMEALSGVVSSVTGQVDELMAGLTSLDATLGAQVAEYLGLEQGSLSTLVQQGLKTLFAEVGRVVAEVKEGLLSALFALPGMESLYQLADFGMEMKEGATWLAAHWQDADLWEQAELLEEELPRFAALLQTAGAWWQGLNATLQSQLSAVTGRIDGWCSALLGIPLLSVVAGAVTSLVHGAQRMLNSPVWGEIAAASQTGVAFAGTVLYELLELAKVVSAAMLFPPPLILVLMGTAVKVLPECYLPPVFDLLVTIAALGVSTALGPLVAELPALAPTWQASLLGILEGLRGLPVERKQAVLLGFAELLQEGFSDVLYGFGAGLVCGLWDEVCFWFDVAWWLSGVGIAQSVIGLAGSINPLSALWEALSLLDRLGDARQDTPEEQAPETSPPAPPAAEPVQEPQDWPSLEVWMGGLVDNFTQVVSQVWASVVESIVVPLLEKAVTEGAWALGYGGGYAVSFFVVEAALAFLTGGLASLLTLGRGAIAGLKLAVKGGMAALPEVVRATRVVLSWGDDLLGVLRRIPGVEDLIGWLDELWSSASQWLDDILGRADEVPKTPEAPEAPAPDVPRDPETPDAPQAPETPDVPAAPKDPTAPKDPDKTSEEGPETDLAKAARREAEHAFDQVEARLDRAHAPAPRSQVESLVEAQDDTTRGVTYDAALAVTGKSWTVAVTATDDGQRATRSASEEGWVAHDGATPYFAAEDASAANKAFLERSFDLLQQRWLEVVDTPDAQVQIQAAAADQAREFEKQRLHQRTEAVFTFSGWNAEAGSVSVRLRIAPNEQDLTLELVRTMADKPVFAELFPLVSREVHDANFTEAWAPKVAQAALEAGLTFSWTPLFCLTEGRAAIEDKVET
jgi:hypothetical protein